MFSYKLFPLPDHVHTVNYGDRGETVRGRGGGDLVASRGQEADQLLQSTFERSSLQVGQVIRIFEFCLELRRKKVSEQTDNVTRTDVELFKDVHAFLELVITELVEGHEGFDVLYPLIFPLFVTNCC